MWMCVVSDGVYSATNSSIEVVPPTTFVLQAADDEMGQDDWNGRNEKSLFDILHKSTVAGRELGLNPSDR
jgi:hypothetical protein